MEFLSVPLGLQLPDTYDFGKSTDDNREVDAVETKIIDDNMFDDLFARILYKSKSKSKSSLHKIHKNTKKIKVLQNRRSKKKPSSGMFK